MRNKSLLLASLMLITVMLTACGSAAMAQSSQDEDTPPLRTVTVTGSGKTYLTPDLAYISVGVHTENKDATEAVASNNSQSQKVTDALKSFKIDAKDI